MKFRSMCLTTALTGLLPILLGIQECSQPETCFFEEPASFSSVELLECGFTPDGIATCHWSLSFDSGTFTWFHSDMGEIGNYTCSGDSFTTDQGYTGTFDPTTGILTFEGQTYTQN